MCEVLDKIENRGIQKGLERGMTRDLEQGAKQIIIGGEPCSEDRGVHQAQRGASEGFASKNGPGFPNLTGICCEGSAWPDTPFCNGAI